MSFQDDSTPTTEKREDSAEYEAYDAARVLRLHDHIEQLRAERRPETGDMTSAEDAQLFGMAALLHAAAPGVADPNPMFAASLLARLEREADAATATALPVAPAVAATPVAPITPIATQSPETQTTTQQRAPAPLSRAPRREMAARGGRAGAGVSRRGLLAGGLGAAAAAVVGAAGGVLYEQQTVAKHETNNTALVQNGQGVWVAVAAVDAVPLGAVRHFQTEYIIGFIRHTEQGFSALSGVCTHMSCLLVWNSGARTFDCPCHGGRFSEDGKAAWSSPIAYSPLPAIKTKVEQGQVWVYVIPPTSPTSATPSGDATSGDRSGGYTR